MKKWEQEAIRLKYQGKTYQEIAKEISKLCRITIHEQTMKNAFTVDGRLYLDYLKYEGAQNNWTDEHSRQEYKRLAAETSAIQEQLLKQAMKKGDFRLAWDIVKDINDRAGLVVVRKSEVNVDDQRERPIENYEQFVQDLERQGIDPRTGLRVATPSVGAN